MSAFDNTMMFFSSGNLTKRSANTALYPTGGLKVRGTGPRSMAVRINFPSGPGTTVKLLPEIHASDNNSTYRLVATYPGGAQSWTKSTSKELIFGFVTDKPYVKLYFKLVAGGTTASSYGAVKAGIVEPPGFEWSRTVRAD
jgi:hypothetical protein